MVGSLSLRTMACLLASSALLSACEHPIAVVTPHAEVAELMLTDSTDASIMVRTTDNRTWSGGPLVLCDGQVRTFIPHALDFRGMPVDLVSRRDLDVRGESEDPLVTWERCADAGDSFRWHRAPPACAFSSGTKRTPIS